MEVRGVLPASSRASEVDEGYMHLSFCHFLKLEILKLEILKLEILKFEILHRQRPDKDQYRQCRIREEKENARDRKDGSPVASANKVDVARSRDGKIIRGA